MSSSPGPDEDALLGLFRQLSPKSRKTHLSRLAGDLTPWEAWHLGRKLQSDGPLLSGLADMPPEIVLLILDSLPLPDIFNCLSVCRGWHATWTQPVVISGLYSKFIPDHLGQDDGSIGRFRHLSRTYLRRFLVKPKRRAWKDLRRKDDMFSPDPAMHPDGKYPIMDNPYSTGGLEYFGGRYAWSSAARTLIVENLGTLKRMVLNLQGPALLHGLIIDKFKLSKSLLVVALTGSLPYIMIFHFGTCTWSHVALPCTPLALECSGEAFVVTLMSEDILVRLYTYNGTGRPQVVTEISMSAFAESAGVSTSTSHITAAAGPGPRPILFLATLDKKITQRGFDWRQPFRVAFYEVHKASAVLFANRQLKMGTLFNFEGLDSQPIAGQVVFGWKPLGADDKSLLPTISFIEYDCPRRDVRYRAAITLDTRRRRIETQVFAVPFAPFGELSRTWNDYCFYWPWLDRIVVRAVSNSQGSGGLLRLCPAESSDTPGPVDLATASDWPSRVDSGTSRIPGGWERPESGPASFGMRVFGDADYLVYDCGPGLYIWTFSEDSAFGNLPDRQRRVERPDSS